MYIVEAPTRTSKVRTGGLRAWWMAKNNTLLHPKKTNRLQFLFVGKRFARGNTSPCHPCHPCQCLPMATFGSINVHKSFTHLHNCPLPHQKDRQFHGSGFSWFPGYWHHLNLRVSWISMTFLLNMSLNLKHVRDNHFMIFSIQGMCRWFDDRRHFLEHISITSLPKMNIKHYICA